MQPLVQKLDKQQGAFAANALNAESLRISQTLKSLYTLPVLRGEQCVKSFMDMDCFFAAVEMRDNPALRDIPIAIGGSRERRGG